MTPGPFDSPLEALPVEIPIFPLDGVLLLPGGRLPLNVFEPRYLAMTLDSLANGRMIGMVQPMASPLDSPGSANAVTGIYDIGCAGRICSFSETGDGRLLITLAGVCRFRLIRELDGVKEYRRVAVDYSGFRGDLDPPTGSLVDRVRLLASLGSYLTLHNIAINWKALDNFSDAALVTTASMLCPFVTREKQALLEAMTYEERGILLIALIEMGILELAGGSPRRQ
ncbi:MAG: LON peptidase substrate-binding domain-containing protein [Alphaproteobacteria bacterium]|nr:LON peptidase substrate-binding domain-containing protein [Alphaproteobacteria bacterium]